MQLARTGVGVIDTIDAVFRPQQAVELGDVCRQVPDIDRGVLDDLARLGIAGHVAQQALSGAAEFPDLVALGTPQHRRGVAESRELPGFLDGGRGSLRRLATVAADFHHQDRAGIADDKRAVALLRQVGLGALEDMVVDQFTGARTMGQC